jgi:type IV pilus assembly protein PilX
MNAMPHLTPQQRRKAARKLGQRRHEHGAVLIFGLIALVLMLIGTAAVLRSMNTSLSTAGNFAFKRDLANQGERAVAVVMQAVQTGTLASEVARESHSPDQNYSATLLPTNDQGIPMALLSDTAFATVGRSSNDITLADMGVTVRYVVDRLSTDVGPALADRTWMADQSVPPGGSSSELNNAMDSSSGGSGAVPAQVMYRVSVRVDGPRRTQSFFQTPLKL